MKAEIGDKASFVLLNGGKVFGDILYIPQATGDSWIVQTYFDGKKDLIAYVQSFACMYLMSKKEKP